MAGTTTANWQQYSRWLYVIARNYKINTPTGPELTAISNCIKFFWDTDTRTGSRPWLEQEFWGKSVVPQNTPGAKLGDPDTEPTYNDIKLLEIIARDIKKIPLTSAEQVLVEAVFTATGDEKYGNDSSTNSFGTTI